MKVAGRRSVRRQTKQAVDGAGRRTAKCASDQNPLIFVKDNRGNFASGNRAKSRFDNPGSAGTHEVCNRGLTPLHDEITPDQDASISLNSQRADLSRPGWA